MTGSPVELIKEKLDIAEFLRGYLTLQPAGKNFKALCPFHREKTPSFMISPDRGSWHCFGCSLGGDIFAFVMRYENVEFGDALRILAEKAGIELRRINPAEHRETGLLYDIHVAASEFFKSQLQKSPSAQKYLKERGLTEETIQEFEIGFAPSEMEALGMHLLRLGYRPDDIVRAGLVFKTERGSRIDRFRGRVMFPIHNHFGKVIAFTGRVLPEFDDGKSGKYVNSPESAIFSKSKVLYGFWKSKNHIREAKKVFLVEGQMDFLMSWQAGVKFGVASSGTALTEDHLRVLRRLSDALILSFDADEAGLAAGERAIDLAEANDFNVKVAVFKGFKDPAEAVASNPKNLHDAVASAKPAPEFYFERYLPQGHADFAERESLRNLRVILQKLQHIASPVERGFWFKELAKRAGISESLLHEELNAIQIPKSPEKENAENPAPQATRRYSRKDLISRHLLSAAFASQQFDLLETSAGYFTPKFRRAYELLKSGAKTSEDPELDGILNSIYLRAEEMPPEEMKALESQLTEEHFKEQRLLLSKKVKEAEAAGDEKKLNLALQELSKLPTPFRSA